MFCGNGGSAADCQHLAAEFVGEIHQGQNSFGGDCSNYRYISVNMCGEWTIHLEQFFLGKLRA